MAEHYGAELSVPEWREKLVPPTTAATDTVGTFADRAQPDSIHAARSGTTGASCVGSPVRSAREAGHCIPPPTARCHPIEASLSGC
jgi:hypothetical protein